MLVDPLDPLGSIAGQIRPERPVCEICGEGHTAAPGCPTLIRSASARPAGEPPAVRPVSQPDHQGTMLRSFRLTRVLGRGGMGTVYLGQHELIGSRVAVKVLHSHLAASQAQVARFHAEARTVNLIGHENIINIFDMGTLPPWGHYLVMEYLEGRTLSELVGRPMPPAEAVAILTQVCDALGAAHDRGVVHRDLKPDNIFLTRRGGSDRFVKVLDFGIAKLLASPGKGTEPGTIIGTPEFMAPEQGTGVPIDGRLDLYSLGVIAYKLLTGRSPFHATNLTGWLLAHRNETPVAPHVVHPAVPPALSDVVMRALAKCSSDRFESPARMRAALERAVGRRHGGARPQVSSPQAPRASSLPWLDALHGRLGANHYVFLGVAPDADFSQIHRVATELTNQVESALREGAPPEQLEQLGRVARRLTEVVATLGSPLARAEYDAGLGNYRGVARCIASGLTPTQLEGLRARLLKPSARIEAQVRLQAGTEPQGESRAELSRRLDAYERALTLDPLNPGFHQGYWSLRRRVMQEARYIGWGG